MNYCGWILWSERSKILAIPLFLVISLTWGWAWGCFLCCLAIQLAEENTAVEANSHVGIGREMTCNLYEFLHEQELLPGSQGILLCKLHSPYLIDILVGVHYSIIHKNSKADIHWAVTLCQPLCHVRTLTTKVSDTVIVTKKLELYGTEKLLHR